MEQAKIILSEETKTQKDKIVCIHLQVYINC